MKLRVTRKTTKDKYGSVKVVAATLHADPKNYRETSFLTGLADAIEQEFTSMSIRKWNVTTKREW